MELYLHPPVHLNGVVLNETVDTCMFL